MKKRVVAGLILLFFLAGCANMEPMAAREETYGRGVPAINQAFASKQIRPGDSWKVYLNASDPDGNMTYIVSEVSQPGVGPYPISRTRVKEGDRKEFSGYVYLNTFSFAGSPSSLNYVNLTLTVWIQDRAGHYSNPAVFLTSFNPRHTQEPPPPGAFKERDLGPIMVNLGTVTGGIRLDD